MKKRTMLSVLTLCLAAFLLFAGCTANEAPAPAPEDAPVTEPAVTPEQTPEVPTTDEESPVKTLIGLIGKPDADVTASLGEGTETTGDDGALLVREYGAKIYELDSQLYVNYEGDTVSSVTVTASENKFDDWADQLTTELGQPSQTSGETEDGNNSSMLSWTLDDGVMVSLTSAYDVLGLEIFVGA